MELLNRVQEEITTDVNVVTREVLLHVVMTSYNNTPFEFTSYIDDIGQIILTPVSKEVEFITVNILSDAEEESPIHISNEISNNSVLETKELTIRITVSMLCETDSCDFSAAIDDIGQVVIYPTSQENTFITASVEDNLNLVTEELQVVDYFGYKLINTGDGWDIKDYTNNVIETGVATEAEAKIIVLQTELSMLKNLTEEVTSNQSSTEDETEDNVKPNIEAEVIEESLNNLEETVNVITNNYTESQGAILCDTEDECLKCKDILALHYDDVSVVEQENNKYVVVYSSPIVYTSPEVTVND